MNIDKLRSMRSLLHEALGVMYNPLTFVMDYI